MVVVPAFTLFVLVGPAVASDGVLRLCSVFSSTAPALIETAGKSSTGPCGNALTYLQVGGAVKAINALNGNRGFAVTGGNPSNPSYIRMNYTYYTYDFGTWDAVPPGKVALSGRELSKQVFSGCEIVIGMANGCPDVEIAKQAAVANATKRIYVTARGPRAVMLLQGRNPHFFSIHLNSDRYALPALKAFRHAGRAKVHVIFENYGNYFYTDLGTTTVTLAKSLGFNVTFANLTRTAKQVCSAPHCTPLPHEPLAYHPTPPPKRAQSPTHRRALIPLRELEGMTPQHGAPCCFKHHHTHRARSNTNICASTSSDSYTSLHCPHHPDPTISGPAALKRPSASQPANT